MLRILILGILLSVSVVAQESLPEKGIALFQEGKYAEAVDVLRKATEVGEQKSATWLYLIFSYIKLSDLTAVNSVLESYKKTKFNPPFVQPKAYDTPVRFRDKPKADYTGIARRAGIRGEVLLWIEFLSDGKIGAIFIKQPLSHGLTENAIKAARKLRFEPAIRNGKPVTVVLAFSYGFDID